MNGVLIPETAWLQVTEACKQCRDRRVRCGGGFPCAVCVSRSEECVYEKRVDVQKKRGSPMVRVLVCRPLSPRSRDTDVDGVGFAVKSRRTAGAEGRE